MRQDTPRSIKPAQRTEATKGNPNLATVDKAVRPELRPGSRTCQCPTCDLYFTGLQPFDRHLVSDEDGRILRCLSVDEMHSIGMVRNRHGVWQYGQSLKAQAA